MAKRKRKHLTGFGKFLLFLLLVGIILLINSLFNEEGTNIITDYNDLNNKEKSEYITDSSESDSDIINTYFADGLSVNDFKKVLNQKEKYIKSNGEYESINYDFDRKLHYSEIEDILKNLNNSSIVKLENIGKSVDNRNIYGIEIGNGSNVLYLDANVHAAEVANTLILTRFLSEIVNNYENNDKDIVNILNSVKIVAIVCMNPDGYEIYNYGVESLNNKNLWWYQNRDAYDFSSMKSNANGVDLNRNFPTQNAGLYYNKYSLIKNVALEKTTKNSIYFGGYSLGSEPETKAAMYFMLKHYKNTYAYINMHSQGRVIYAGKPNLDSNFNDLCNSFAKKVSGFNGYKVHGLSSEEVGEGNDGSVTDFMAELANGFVFSTKTGRLSTDKYIDNSSSMKYSYPVITMETLTQWTTNQEVFKNEYYNQGIRNLLYDLLNK